MPVTRLVQCVLLSFICLPLLAGAECNESPNPAKDECRSPKTDTNCAVVCRTMKNYGVSCPKCCDKLPGKTNEQRDQCKLACQNQPPAEGAPPPTLPVDVVPDITVESIVVNPEYETLGPWPDLPCSCQYLSPCTAEETEIVYERVPEFWINDTFSNFICSLTTEEREQLAQELGNRHNEIYSVTQEELAQYMAVLDDVVLEIMANNNVEGQSQYTFYANNVLYVEMAEFQAP